jgi:hypothetical protein
MFAYLGRVLLDFPGSINQTQCFMHTINLCAKSILKHFNLPKKDANDSINHAANALVDLADNIEHEADRGWQEGNHDEEEAADKEYSEVWAHICNSLADNKIHKLELSIQPARSMLVKVCPSL